MISNDESFDPNNTKIKNGMVISNSFTNSLNLNKINVFIIINLKFISKFFHQNTI